MSDWMLYHVWGIRGYRTTGIEKLNQRMTLVTLEPLPSVYRCPKCGSKDVIRKGTKSRLLRGTPVGRCQMLLEAAIPRVLCERCGITRQVRVPFAEEKHRHTRQFERYALELAGITTTQHAAEHLGVACPVEPIQPTTRMSALQDFANSSAIRRAIWRIWDSPALRFDSSIPAILPAGAWGREGRTWTRFPSIFPPA